jgi:hypothetical protein
MKVGSITETRYSVTPDDVEISNFCNNRHLKCITLNMTMTTAAGAVTLDNASVKSQLTNAISVQNKEVQWSQTTYSARKLKGRLKEKTRSKTEPIKFTLPSSTCYNVPQPLIKMKRQKKSH